MRPSLFDRFPGTSGLPLAGVADLPTPLEELNLPEDALASGAVGRLQVKRDDRTSLRYGGNKVRKLDFLLGQALAEGRSTVLTFGAYGSNHALATAVHARALGLEPHVVLSPQEPGPFAPTTLLAHAALGTVIHLAEGWDGRREAVRARRAIIDRDALEPYVIPMGGTCSLGAVGYVNAALEVADADGGAPDIVYVAAGTLGTAVGLAVGFAAAGSATRVEAVRVTPLELCNDAVAAELAAETSRLLHEMDSGFPQLALEDVALTLRHEFFGPGYGVVTAETTDAVAVAADAGLSLETTYTGKAFSAFLADARSDRLRGQDVVFWDTYNSAPYAEQGRVEDLPEALQKYIAECWRQFPGVG